MFLWLLLCNSILVNESGPEWWYIHLVIIVMISEILSSFQNIFVEFDKRNFFTKLIL